MKRVLYLIFVLVIITTFCSCGQDNEKTNNTTTEKHTEATTEAIYKDSKYLGKWYNADSAKNEFICTLNANGTAVFKNDKNATWEETPSGITITATVKDKKTVMEGYFVISGDGFVARATEQNQHYLDENKGELQLEIMLTENTCVDCIKK